MDQILRKIEGHLQDMEGSQRQLARELDDVKQTMDALIRTVGQMSRTVDQTVEITVELRGAFAGIGQILSDHETRIAALEAKLAS